MGQMEVMLAAAGASAMVAVAALRTTIQPKKSSSTPPSACSAKKVSFNEHGEDVSAKRATPSTYNSESPVFTHPPLSDPEGMDEFFKGAIPAKKDPSEVKKLENELRNGNVETNFSKQTGSRGLDQQLRERYLGSEKKAVKDSLCLAFNMPASYANEILKSGSEEIVYTEGELDTWLSKSSS